MRNNWYNWEVSRDADTAVLRIDGVIGGDWFDEDPTTDKKFISELSALDGRNVELHVNSPGGAVFQGFAIYNALAGYRAKGARVDGFVDGSAMSIASVLLMACGKISMPGNSFQMIHHPWVGVCGNAKELRAEAERLDKLGGSIRDIYAARTGKSAADMDKLLAGADGADGSFLSAGECLDLGLCDEVLPNVAAAACVGGGHWRGVPSGLMVCDVAAKPDDYAAWKSIVEQLKGF